MSSSVFWSSYRVHPLQKNYGSLYVSEKLPHLLLPYSKILPLVRSVNVGLGVGEGGQFPKWTLMIKIITSEIIYWLDVEEPSTSTVD